jgi:hypothetical protein
MLIVLRDSNHSTTLPLTCAAPPPTPILTSHAPPHHPPPKRLLASRYLAEDFYDLVDVDSFGSEASHLPAAIDAVKFGGMLFLTSTDGMSSAGAAAAAGLGGGGVCVEWAPCPPKALPSATPAPGLTCGAPAPAHLRPPPVPLSPSAGKRPERSLASYGAYLRSLPFSNEQGLRMVVGAAVREAAARGVVLRPLFSYFSFHG